MTVLFAKEWRSYFATPMGYLFLSVFAFICGWYFFAGNLSFRMSDLSGVFSALYNICLFILPLLTMKLFSDEKRHKTQVLLFTSPLTTGEIVGGKVLSAYLFFLLASSVTVFFAFCMHFLTRFLWGLFLCQFLGLVLLGFAFLALSSFIASFAQSQMISAVLSIASLFLFHLSDSLTAMTSNTALQRALASMSPLKNYTAFVSGNPSLQNLLFFVSFGGFFYYLTVVSVTVQREGLR